MCEPEVQANLGAVANAGLRVQVGRNAWRGDEDQRSGKTGAVQHMYPFPASNGSTIRWIVLRPLFPILGQLVDKTGEPVAGRR